MSLAIGQMQINALTDPQGIDSANPAFSWTLDADRRGAAQTAYRIIVASGTERLRQDEGDMWDSGRIDSQRTNGIRYEGKPLASGRPYWWKVTVWDENGNRSDWSDTATWSMGLLSRKEWRGKWIGLKSPHRPTHAEPKPAVYLRGSFTVAKPVRRAMLYGTALGAYELSVNGRRIGADTLTPDWTDYNIRVQYQAYDLTGELAQGENTIAALLGQGWYAGYIGMFGYQKYGQNPRLLVQLNVEYEDGTTASFVSDASWKASFGPLLATDFHMGETYDARLEQPGWERTGFDDSGWNAADIFYEYKGHIVSAICPPVRTMLKLAPQSIVRKEAGRCIVDMGQNMVGRLQLRVRGGAAGDTVVIRHGEALDEAGELYTANLRLSRQIDTFMLAGESEEVLEPHFTLHGFRYAEITGSCADRLEAADIVGVVVFTGLEQAGKLETSSPLLNKLVSNIEWTQRGNFVSVPTDCPQRDERLGWSGDAQVFFRTAAYLMKAEPFFAKWMVDLTDAQRPTGAFTDFAPFIPGGKTEHGGDMTYDHTASAGWGDAGIIVPWEMYRVYGDVGIIERHFDAMARWIDFLAEMHPGHLREDLPQYGDWLSLAEAAGLGDFPNVAQFSTTPYDVFATAYYAYSAGLMAKMAALIGRHDDERRFAELNGAIKEAYNRAYVDAAGRIKGDTQSAYAMALYMDLLPEDKRDAAFARIVELLEARDWHLSTGIHGSRYILDILVRYGRGDIARRLLLTQTYPSWFYSILQGATTIWERWDGWTEEKGFQRPGMNSFNHYALGAVGEWIFRRIGGIDTDDTKPGFRHIRIEPLTGGELTHADCTYRSVVGTIGCSWRSEGERLRMSVRIPAGATATVRVPVRGGQQVWESGVPVEEAAGIRVAGREDGCVLLDAGSGDYEFDVR
ncbi:alpha-L-rhamnosidase [Paenibacillus cymbidii]|uniref:alpha-L-rhamnosidase n=1 Tax=Paenibacillus cymbidii TaxID=1639034 RepID=UPI001436998C|nr:alpha-L-rhamnosidase [Paenibacillus cymbidii]